MPQRGRRPAELLLLAVLLAAVCATHLDVLRLSWTYDDAFLLRVADASEIDQYFASRELWRGMPAQMFVPLLFVWYEAGSRTSGEDDARGFYGLALAVLCAALLAVYLALRQWLGATESLAATALIGLGPPVVSLVMQLMTTHYVIALLFAALAVWLAVVGWRLAGGRLAVVGGRLSAKTASDALPPTANRQLPTLLAIASALCYLAAMLAKEVAIPLPVLLLLLPGRRVRFLVPHVIALAVYFAWRKWMIGVFLGGYGWAVTGENVGPLVRSLPRQLVHALTPPQWWIAVLLGLVLLVPIAWRMRSRAFAIAVVVALGAAIAPVLPVSRQMEPRYAFATWVTLAVLFAVAARGKVWLCVAAVVLVALAQRLEVRDALPLSERMSAETRFVLTAPADATLRLPKTPPAAMGELQRLRTEHGAAPGLQWFYDDLYLCGGKHQGRRLYEYDEARDRIVEVTPRAEHIARKHCTSIRNDAPLRTTFDYDDQTLHWTFGPYGQGTWSLVFADGVQAFTVPGKDAYRVGGMPGIALRVRYDAPEGWTTYSPDLVLDFAKQPHYEWQR